MKIGFETRDHLVNFLNATLGVGTPFDFEVDGKKIEFFDLEKDDLSMLRAMALSEGGSVEEPPRKAPSRDHRGPLLMTLCTHDILLSDCAPCKDRRWFEVEPNTDELEKAAEDLVVVRIQTRARGMDRVTTAKLTEVRMALAKAARVYARRVTMRLDALRIERDL